LDLLSVSGGGSCSSDLLALCLPSFQIAIAAADCSVAITPLVLNGGSAYVPAIWSTDPGSTYQRFMACPSSTTTAVTPAGSPSPTTQQLQDAVQAALQQHVYGSSFPQIISSMVWASGTVNVTLQSSGCLLKYAITQVNKR
jgi:hypothetical protein